MIRPPPRSPLFPYTTLFRSGRTNVGTKSAGMLRLVRPISIRSRKPAVVRIATRAPRRSSTALVPTVVPWTSRRTWRPAMPRASRPARTAAASFRGSDGTLVTTTRPVASSTAVRSVNVPPTSIPTMNTREMIASGQRGEATHGHERRRDPAPLDPQDAGPSLARRRGAGDRARRGRLRLDRARQEAHRRLRRSRGRQRGSRPARDRRGDRRADRAPGLLSDDSPVLEPSGRRAGGQDRLADAGRPRLFVLRGQRGRGQRARDADVSPLLACFWRARQAQGHLAPGRLPRRDDRHLRRLWAAALDAGVHRSPRAGLREGDAAIPVPRSRRRHRQGAGNAPRARAPRGDRQEGPEAGVG